MPDRTAALVYIKTPFGEYAPEFWPSDSPFWYRKIDYAKMYELEKGTEQQMLAGDIHLSDLVERYPPPGPLSGTQEKRKDENSNRV